MCLVNFADQVQNIRETIKCAVDSKEPRITDVKAPFCPKEGYQIDFKYCEIFVHASGNIGFKPTERTYQRVCDCCGNVIKI